MTTDLEREAREAAEAFYPEGQRYLTEEGTRIVLRYGTALESARSTYIYGYLAAATLREKEVEELRAKLVQQAHDYRAQVVFWGENADQRTAEIAILRARVAEASSQLTEAKSAIRWMHGYDEPGTEAFPICHEYKRYAWRGVARKQFAIVREACAEPIPVPKTNDNASQQGA